MSEKQRGGIRKCLPVVLEELKEGIDIRALRDKGDCRHDTLYAIRDILSGAKLIFEEGGKWYYTCKKEKEELLKDYQEFKNKDEYDTKLNHSKNLLKQAIAEEESNEFNVDLYRFQDSYNFTFFLQHLKTGYPDIYKLYEKVEKNNFEMEEAFSALLQKIKEGTLERGVELSKYPEKFNDLQKEIDKMPENIFYSLKEYLNYFFDKDRKIKYTSAAMEVTFPVYSKEERKEFIKYCSHSEDIKKLHSELVELTKERAKDYACLHIDIKSIIIKVVEDGEPLRGTCDRCPKVTIGRSP